MSEPFYFNDRQILTLIHVCNITKLYMWAFKISNFYNPILSLLLLQCNENLNNNQGLFNLQESLFQYCSCFDIKGNQK